MRFKYIFKDGTINFVPCNEKSLMYASQQHKKLVDDHMVRFVIEHEMQYEGKGVMESVRR